ncbi:MAG TPA: peptide chain release factor 2, partial [Firmicutes bacterium]|nr:peptide chain release factor 2 [Bacillota bacterium]
MEMYEIRAEIKKMSERIEQFFSSLNVSAKEIEIKAFDDQMQAPGFWDDQREAQVVINAANA